MIYMKQVLSIEQMKNLGGSWYRYKQCKYDMDVVSLRRRQTTQIKFT